ncbi:hypothetical protein E4U55_005826 [Claviceps digitariae]|nr:hypothetical protein E4U55_005826 [Claviceps digitariae]
MPWKPAAASIYRPRAGSKSIRGQISSPIPILNPLDDELLMQDRPSTTTNDCGAIVNDAGVDDADAVPRQAVGGSGDQLGTRYASVSSRSTGNYTFQGQLPDATSSLPARTSISPKSSLKAASQVRQSCPPISDMDGKRDERSGQSHQHRRKKSVIRSALGKLFGRKNKSQQHSDDTTPRLPSSKTTSAEPSIRSPDQQSRSDPSGERPPTTSHSIVESKRSLSAPITEYDRALRSHSIGPEDVMAIQSARNSLSADFRLSGKCMNLLDSSTHPDNSQWTGGSRPVGLSPRPASSQDRTFTANVNEDPNEIGRAISCDPQGLKRRSRSLTCMPNFDIMRAPSPPRPMARRRSAEIRYWRNGHAAPLMSPKRTLTDDETLHLPMQDIEEPEMELELELEPETLPELEQPLQLTPQSTSNCLHSLSVVEARAATPPQSAVTNQREQSEEEERVTHQSKSPARSIDDPGWVETNSLESRVSNLETRMSRLEGIVIQLGNGLSVLRQPNKESRLEMASTGERRPSVRRLSTCHSNTSKTTFGDVGEVTPRATVVAPTMPSSKQHKSAAEDSTGCSAGHVALEHYTNLLALLETERSAREALEDQVRSLGNQMHLISKSVTYTDQSDSPSLNRSLGEISVFDHEEEEGDDDDDDDHHRRLIAASGYVANPLGLDDSGISTAIRPDDDECTECFVRPAEMTSSDLDAFGNGDEDTKLPPSCMNKLSCLCPTTMPQGVPMP